MTALRLNAVHLRVGERVLADSINAHLKAGQFWAVLGRNGAGKSTLLRTLAGLRRIDGGEIRIDEDRLDQLSPRELARRRAFLPQQVSDTFSATVLDTVKMARYPFYSSLARHIGFDSDEDLALAQRALADLGVSHWQERDVLTLSGGERRLVALATVFAQEVPMLLLDEPAAHLDVDVCERVFKALSARTLHGACVLASVHDPDLAARHASHVLLLKPHGGCLAGPMAEVLLESELRETFGHGVRKIEVDGRPRFLTL